MQVTAEPKHVAGLGWGLTEAQAREIYRQGEEAVVWALLQQSKLLGESTRSGGAGAAPGLAQYAFVHAAGVHQAPGVAAA